MSASAAVDVRVRDRHGDGKRSVTQAHESYALQSLRSPPEHPATCTWSREREKQKRKIFTTRGHSCHTHATMIEVTEHSRELEPAVSVSRVWHHADHSQVGLLEGCCAALVHGLALKTTRGFG